MSVCVSFTCRKKNMSFTTPIYSIYNNVIIYIYVQYYIWRARGRCFWTSSDKKSAYRAGLLKYQFLNWFFEWPRKDVQDVSKHAALGNLVRSQNNYIGATPPTSQFIRNWVKAVTATKKTTLNPGHDLRSTCWHCLSISAEYWNSMCSLSNPIATPALSTAASAQPLPENSVHTRTPFQSGVAHRASSDSLLANIFAQANKDSDPTTFLWHMSLVLGKSTAECWRRLCFSSVVAACDKGQRMQNSCWNKDSRIERHYYGQNRTVCDPAPAFLLQLSILGWLHLSCRVSLKTNPQSPWHESRHQQWRPTSKVVTKAGYPTPACFEGFLIVLITPLCAPLPSLWSCVQLRCQICAVGLWDKKMQNLKAILPRVCFPLLLGNIGLQNCKAQLSIVCLSLSLFGFDWKIQAWFEAGRFLASALA